MNPPRAAVPLFFGAASRSLFGWYHAPAEPRRATGVVICNPIGDDDVRAHRPLRHLAERLARAGLAVLRFDFDGTGDSSRGRARPGARGHLGRTTSAWPSTSCARLSGCAAICARRACGSARRWRRWRRRAGATSRRLVLWSAYGDGAAGSARRPGCTRCTACSSRDSFAAEPQRLGPGRPGGARVPHHPRHRRRARPDRSGAPRGPAGGARARPRQRRRGRGAPGGGARTPRRGGRSAAAPENNFLVMVPHKAPLARALDRARERLGGRVQRARRRSPADRRRRRRRRAGGAGLLRRRPRGSSASSRVRPPRPRASRRRR